MGDVIDFRAYAVTGVLEPNKDGPDELEHVFNESLVDVFKQAYTQYIEHNFSSGEHTIMAEWFMLMGATLIMEELHEVAVVDLLKAELDRIRNAG